MPSPVTTSQKAAAMLPFHFVLCLFLAFVCVGPAGSAETWPTPKTPVTHIVVQKSKRTMELWIGDIKLRSYKISLGRDPIGHKEREGDGRTPEGRYILDFRKSDSVAYKALHVSYPSAQDAAHARAKGVKPGGAIMIHGSWNGYAWAGPLLKYFDWTNGCIGVTNAEMDDMWDLLAWKTPIEIRP
jgi:murein L,D-transpeptidase YafK